MSERKIWFITRPERDPKFHRDALLALKDATSDFSIKWTRNRAAHLNYERELNRRGIKRENLSNDGSGGRTWAAMLKTFAYVFTDENGFLIPTKVGQKILEGIKVRDNVTKQILTLQIPNSYYLETGFRPQFEEGFRIRPARFLIKLVNQPQLDFYLTKEEITYFALTAKNDNEVFSVTQKIVQFRGEDNYRKSLIKQEIAELYDHRERSDKGARDFELAHGDVAHTFMLICDYTGLVEYIRGESLRIDQANSKKVSEVIGNYDKRYPFNTRYFISLQRLAENNGLDIDSYKASNFWDIKPATNRAKTANKITELLSYYPNVDDLTNNDLKNILIKEFSLKEAEKYVYEIKEVVNRALNNDFVEGYLNEEDNLVFEDKTGEVFKAIGFDVEMRPKPVAKVDTEIEILLKVGKNHSIIIDAKNYRTKFALTASLASHMASEYIPNYEGYDDREVLSYGYVTAADWSGEKNLEKISNLAKRAIPNRDVKGIMLSAKVLLGFLDYCIENNLPKQERINLFISSINNSGYSSVGEFISTIKNKTLYGPSSENQI
jgi:hypothetical protein